MVRTKYRRPVQSALSYLKALLKYSWNQNYNWIPTSFTLNRLSYKNLAYLQERIFSGPTPETYSEQVQNFILKDSWKPRA